MVPLLVTRPLATPLANVLPGCCGHWRMFWRCYNRRLHRGDALRIYRVFFGYLHGHILTELQEVVERPEETDDVLRLGLHRLAMTQFPHVRGLASPWPLTTAPRNSTTPSICCSLASPPRCRLPTGHLRRSELADMVPIPKNCYSLGVSRNSARPLRAVDSTALYRGMRRL